MSENKNIPNEEELWDLLSEPVTTETKKPRFLKSEPKSEPKPEPKAEPAVKPEPVAEAPKEEAPAVEAPKAAPKTEEIKTEAPKAAKRFDGFFVACMAGVAAVSVAATMLLGGMFGGSSAGVNPPAQGTEPGAETGSAYVAELELENAQLRAQLDQQKEQIKDLQSDLLTLMGSEEYLANIATDPSGTNEELDAQLQALETFAAVQEAYADFDREKLEELIPQMDEQITYLTPEARNNYYLILEYMEQPSNG